MKKVFAFILVITICLTTSACSSCKSSGHTTDFGTCSTCGKLINDHKIVTVPIQKSLSPTESALNEVLNFVTYKEITPSEKNYLNDYLTTDQLIEKAQIEIEYRKKIDEISEDLNEAYLYIEDDYQYQAELKGYMDKMKTALENLSELNYNEFKGKGNFLEQYDIYMENLKEAKKWLNKWNYEAVCLEDENYY